MNVHEERLARLAKLPPLSQVGVYAIDRGVTIWIWLCGKHVKTREAAGWAVKEQRTPPQDLPCQDCQAKSAEATQ